MKQCPLCKEEILDDAIKCKHCGENLETYVKEQEKKKNEKNAKAIAIVIVLGVLVYVGWNFFSFFEDTAPTPTSVPQYQETITQPQPTPQVETQSEPLLEVQSFNVYPEYGYVHISGEVKNISNKPLENVSAVGLFLDKNDELVKTDDALIDYNPILAGQTSPFDVLTSGNPEITSGRLEFKYLFGGKIPTRLKAKE